MLIRQLFSRLLIEKLLQHVRHNKMRVKGFGLFKDE